MDFGMVTTAGSMPGSVMMEKYLNGTDPGLPRQPASRIAVDTARISFLMPFPCLFIPAQDFIHRGERSIMLRVVWTIVMVYHLVIYGSHVFVIFRGKIGICKLQVCLFCYQRIPFGFRGSEGGRSEF